MPNFYYTLENHRIVIFNGAVPEIPEGFQPYKGEFIAGKIYYKLKGSKMGEIICSFEGDEEKCHAEVRNFLDKLHTD